MAMPSRADTPVGVGVVPPSGTATAELGASTGTMLSVLAVLFTASSTSCGIGKRCVRIGAAQRQGGDGQRVTGRAANECLRIMEPPG